MDRYTHSYQGEQSAAMATLPDLPETLRQAARATGTDDARVGEQDLALCLAENERRGAVRVGAGGHSLPTCGASSAHEKPQQHRNKRGFDGEIGEGGIRTPGTGVNQYDGLANRWFQPLTHLS